MGRDRGEGTPTQGVRQRGEGTPTGRGRDRGRGTPTLSRRDRGAGDPHTELRPSPARVWGEELQSKEVSPHEKVLFSQMVLTALEMRTPWPRCQGLP